MPRTTLDIDAAVLRELKHRQKRENKPLGQLASELMARALAEPMSSPASATWATSKMGNPKIDLEDKDAIWAVLDER